MCAGGKQGGTWPKKATSIWGSPGPRPHTTRRGPPPQVWASPSTPPTPAPGISANPVSIPTLGGLLLDPRFAQSPAGIAQTCVWNILCGPTGSLLSQLQVCWEPFLPGPQFAHLEKGVSQPLIMVPPALTAGWIIPFTLCGNLQQNSSPPASGLLPSWFPRPAAPPPHLPPLLPPQAPAIQVSAEMSPPQREASVIRRLQPLLDLPLWHLVCEIILFSYLLVYYLSS